MILLVVVIILLIVMSIGLGMVCYFLFRTPPQKVEGGSKSLDELVSIIRAEKEELSREKMEEELRQYGLRKIDQNPGGIRMSNGEDNSPVRGGREYVPYNLSDAEKETLRQFYGRDF